MSAIVLSPNTHNYRKVAQLWYGLTDAQLEGIDVHHNPPRCEGGRNIPEHLFIYHPITHKAVHDKEARDWASKSSGNTNGKRGRPPTKTTPTQLELEVLRRRNLGESRKEISKSLGLSENQVKRSIRECIKFGWKYQGKPGPKPNLPQRGGVAKGTNQPNQYTKQ